jgi:hypothetical protein
MAAAVCIMGLGYQAVLEVIELGLSMVGFPLQHSVSQQKHTI